MIGRTLGHYRVLEKLAYVITPVTVIDGEVIVGFTRAIAGSGSGLKNVVANRLGAATV